MSLGAEALWQVPYSYIEARDGGATMATKQLNTSVDSSLYERLDRLATRTGRSRSHYAAEFIERGLNDLEDHYLLKDSLQEFYATDEESIAHEDVDWDALGR